MQDSSIHRFVHRLVHISTVLSGQRERVVDMEWWWRSAVKGFVIRVCMNGRCMATFDSDATSDE